MSERRDTLRKLWAGLSPDDPMDPQLDRVIQSAHDLEPWRDALIRTPLALQYCESTVYAGTAIQFSSSGAPS